MPPFAAIVIVHRDAQQSSLCDRASASRRRPACPLQRADLLERSAGVATLASSTRVITSPALIPAFSAAEPFDTDRTSTPSFTPKYSASCPSSASRIDPQRRASPGHKAARNIRHAQFEALASERAAPGVPWDAWARRRRHAAARRSSPSRSCGAPIAHDVEFDFASRRRFPHQPRELLPCLRRAAPLYCMIASPAFSPAFSAGLSGSTRVISTPASSRSFSAFARSLSISCTITPM